MKPPLPTTRIVNQLTKYLKPWLPDERRLQKQRLYLPLPVLQPVILLCTTVTCSQECSSIHHAEYHCDDARGQTQFVLLTELWRCYQTLWECCQPTAQKNNKRICSLSDMNNLLNQSIYNNKPYWQYSASKTMKNTINHNVNNWCEDPSTQ